MTDCSLFITREEYQQHLFNFNLLTKRIDDLSARLDVIENTLNKHINESICNDNAHGGLEKLDVVIELQQHNLTVYVSICDQVFEDSVSLEDLFMNIEVKIDEVKINQELIINSIKELSINVENNNLVNNIEIIKNTVTSLQFLVTNQIFNVINRVKIDQDFILNSITTINQNYLTSIQFNDHNQSTVNLLLEFKNSLETIKSLVVNLDFDSTQINSIDRSVDRILNNQSIHIGLTRRVDNIIVNELNTVYNNLLVQYQQIVRLIESINFNNTRTNNLIQQIQISQQNILLLVSNLKNYDDVNIVNSINQLSLNIQSIIISLQLISSNIKPEQVNDNYKLWDCDLEQEVKQPISNLATGLYYLNSQLYDIQNKVCDLESDCDELLPTDLAVWVNYGYYMLFYWKWENKNIKTGLRKTQLPSPIKELINPKDVNAIWNQYFNEIHRIVGVQYAHLYTDNVKTPIYQGWFLNSNEAIRFFDSIIPFTSLSIRQNNNPAFPQYANHVTKIKNTGEKLLLRRVCIVEKLRYSDEIKQIISYAPPK